VVDLGEAGAGPIIADAKIRNPLFVDQPAYAPQREPAAEKGIPGIDVEREV